MSTTRKAIVLNEDEYYYPLHMLGSISVCHADESNDVVAQLHAIVKEATGRTVEVKPKQRMGFLP